MTVLPEDGSFIPRVQDIEQVIGSYTKKMAKSREEYLGYGERGAVQA